MQPTIFISYRREDSAGHAGRLFGDLAQRLGHDAVFMDVAGIPPGRDFRKEIDQQVGACGVLLAVLGPHWVDARDSAGQRRLDNPADYVRLETGTALRRDIPVVPVLVNGARMVQPEDLPSDLAELAYRNAFELRDTRWQPDVELLATTLRAMLQGRGLTDTVSPQPNTATPPVPPAAAQASAAAAAAAPRPGLVWRAWAGAGLAAVGLAGVAFLALWPVKPARTPPSSAVAAAAVPTPTGAAAMPAPRAPASATLAPAAAPTQGLAGASTPAAARGAAVSTLTVSGWELRTNGCGVPVAVKGVATFTIQRSGRGVRVTQGVRAQQQGWNVRIQGEGFFDAPRAGTYDLDNRGEWTHAQGARFRTEGRVMVVSPDGLKPTAARGVIVRTVCPGGR